LGLERKVAVVPATPDAPHTIEIDEFHTAVIHNGLGV